jgi:glyoxylase-like metal-dependent hydrolase (beta-lactamase superfamily II)
MRELAEGVWQLSGLVPHLINAYLVRTADGDVLIDAGTRWVAGRLLRQLRGRRLAGVALTHVHPDHQGAVAEVCRRFRVPLACHEADADVMEGKSPMRPTTALVRAFGPWLAGAPYPVTRRLKDGDLLGEWRVVHAPGHTPGHVVYHRQRDGVAIAGDLMRNTLLPFGLDRPREPPWFFSVDVDLNRRSIRTLLALRPTLVCFGHGPPSRDLAALERLAAGLLPPLSPGWERGRG